MAKRTLMEANIYFQGSIDPITVQLESRCPKNNTEEQHQNSAKLVWTCQAFQ
jgi:hypothetical protein